MANTEPILIEGLSIGGFRSFGAVQRIGPFKKVNVFVGANNSGKSNVLSYIFEGVRELN
jgi:AAA15 family ATPase/GTPase